MSSDGRQAWVRMKVRTVSYGCKVYTHGTQSEKAHDVFFEAV